MNGPNPGSGEAIAQGCCCPLFDNEFGAGFPWPDPDDPTKSITAFWHSQKCPLHGWSDDDR